MFRDEQHDACIKRGRSRTHAKPHFNCSDPPLKHGHMVSWGLMRKCPNAYAQGTRWIIHPIKEHRASYRTDSDIRCCPHKVEWLSQLDAFNDAMMAMPFGGYMQW
jgi:hypothetical protein